MAVAPSTFYYLSYGILAFLVVITNVVILPILPQMLLYTGSILYIACHHSLMMFNKDPETGEVAEVETLSRRDAMMFPVAGSVALFSMYVAYKFFGKYVVNLLLTTYLSAFGLAALGESLRPVMRTVVPANWLTHSFKREFHIPFLQKAEESLVKLSFGNVDVFCYAVSAGLTVVYLITKHFTIHNLFAISFCIQAIALISLGRFQVAFILLIGLFFYDIFWVFGTEVMVSVATQFQGPVKVIFPASFDPWKQSILGLGDIVIPGIFLAMCLRFDAFRHRSNASQVDEAANDETLDYRSQFAKPYFWAVWLSYLLSLCLTGVIMFVFDRAQPALLYLVPGTMLALTLTSLARGQFSEMLAYNEEHLASEKTEEQLQENNEAESDKKTN